MCQLEYLLAHQLKGTNLEKRLEQASKYRAELASLEASDRMVVSAESSAEGAESDEIAKSGEIAE